MAYYNTYIFNSIFPIFGMVWGFYLIFQLKFLKIISKCTLLLLDLGWENDCSPHLGSFNHFGMPNSTKCSAYFWWWTSVTLILVMRMNIQVFCCLLYKMQPGNYPIFPIFWLKNLFTYLVSIIGLRVFKRSVLKCFGHILLSPAFSYFLSSILITLIFVLYECSYSLCFFAYEFKKQFHGEMDFYH